MWFDFLTSFMIILRINLVDGEGNDWMNSVKEGILMNVKPYEIAIFINNIKQDKLDHLNLITNELVNTIPSITIYTNRSAQTGNGTSFKSPILVNLIQAAVYVMINNGIEVNEEDQITHIKNFIDLFIPMSHKYPKPKCLVLQITIIKGCLNYNK